jgi:hypothetical protein
MDTNSLETAINLLAQYKFTLEKARQLALLEAESDYKRGFSLASLVEETLEAERQANNILYLCQTGK